VGQLVGTCCAFETTTERALLFSALPCLIPQHRAKHRNTSLALLSLTTAQRQNPARLGLTLATLPLSLTCERKHFSLTTNVARLFRPGALGATLGSKKGNSGQPRTRNPPPSALRHTSVCFPVPFAELTPQPPLDPSPLRSVSSAHLLDTKSSPSYHSLPPPKQTPLLPAFSLFTLREHPVLPCPRHRQTHPADPTCRSFQHVPARSPLLEGERTKSPKPTTSSSRRVEQTIREHS
jgi:hypothetical protein